MTPVPVNTPEASLESAVAPGNTRVPSGAAVILNVLVPERNTLGAVSYTHLTLPTNAHV